jgi:myosin-1
MKALMECIPHYIRCIKPNHKAPNDFDSELIGRQVQYLGLIENVRVRCAGFAYRATFERFAKRYGILPRRSPDAQCR